MSLKNSQFDAVMRRYDAIRETNRHQQNQHTEEIYEKLPEVRALDHETAVRSLEAAKKRIADPHADLTSYKESINRISSEKVRLLVQNGYSEDYLDLRFSCPVCQDTGFVDGKHCACFNRISAEVVYGMTGLREVLKRENFDHFSFKWYSDTMLDDSSGRIPAKEAKLAYERAAAFSEKIGTRDNNLYFYGNTGVGKTFLTHCIAADALKKGYSVLCFSSGELFDYLRDSAFSHGEGARVSRDLISDCDVLIIDDLGTELMNAFVGSELFRVINDRTEHNRSTVISTNLAIADLNAKYSERISSRILSHYQLTPLSGEDIRVLKRLRGEE